MILLCSDVELADDGDLTARVSGHDWGPSWPDGHRLTVQSSGPGLRPPRRPAHTRVRPRHETSGGAFQNLTEDRIMEILSYIYTVVIKVYLKFSRKVL